MAIKIGVIGQKGGVGKSTISRLLAVEYSRSNFDVLIADFDPLQATCIKWNNRRLKSEQIPTVDVIACNDVDRVLKKDKHYEVIIFDSAPHATDITKQIAAIVDLIVIPTGLTVDDLEPSITLSNDLKRSGVSKEKIVFVLNRVGGSDAEIVEANNSIHDVGYKCLGHIQEMTSYHRALDSGKSITETEYDSLNERAVKITELIHSEVSKES